MIHPTKNTEKIKKGFLSSFKRLNAVGSGWVALLKKQLEISGNTRVTIWILVEIAWRSTA